MGFNRNRLTALDCYCVITKKKKTQCCALSRKKHLSFYLTYANKMSILLSSDDRIKVVYISHRFRFFIIVWNSIFVTNYYNSLKFKIMAPIIGISSLGIAAVVDDSRTLPHPARYLTVVGISITPPSTSRRFCPFSMFTPCHLSIMTNFWLRFCEVSRVNLVFPIGKGWGSSCVFTVIRFFCILQWISIENTNPGFLLLCAIDSNIIHQISVMGNI